MQEADNILKILQDTKKALKEKNSFEIKNLSDHTINTASRTQDADNIAVAVIIYSLGKVLEKEVILNGQWSKFEKQIIIYLDLAIKNLKCGNEEGTRKYLEEIRKKIGQLSGKIRSYIKDVFRRSEVKKASKIYEHGISMERTAKLLGVTMYELAEYAGPIGILDSGKNVINTKERIKTAEQFFG